jgi:hypothetical protein
MNLRFFDAFVLLGKGMTPPRFDTETPEAVSAMLDHFGIDRALVRTAEQEWNAEEGNRTILTLVEKSARCTPVWVIAPHRTGEFPAPEDLATAMQRANVRALFCTPSIEQPLHATALGGMLAVCEARSIPLLWPCADYAAYERLDTLLGGFPNLLLVACNQHAWGLERYTFPLFERYERFVLCVGPNRVSGAVQETVRRFGAERLIFGSDFPHADPAGATELLRRLDIEDTEKIKIAGGNLERILAEVRI